MFFRIYFKHLADIKVNGLISKSIKAYFIDRYLIIFIYLTVKFQSKCFHKEKAFNSAYIV
jgi:hypothetical protein